MAVSCKLQKKKRGGNLRNCYFTSADGTAGCGEGATSWQSVPHPLCPTRHSRLIDDSLDYFFFSYQLIWYLCCQYRYNYLKIYAIRVCWYLLCQGRVGCSVGSCLWTLREIPLWNFAQERECWSQRLPLETATAATWKRPGNAHLSLKGPSCALGHCRQWAQNFTSAS